MGSESAGWQGLPHNRFGGAAHRPRPLSVIAGASHDPIRTAASPIACPHRKAAPRHRTGRSGRPRWPWQLGKDQQAEGGDQTQSGDGVPDCSDDQQPEQPRSEDVPGDRTQAAGCRLACQHHQADGNATCSIRLMKMLSNRAEPICHDTHELGLERRRRPPATAASQASPRCLPSTVAARPEKADRGPPTCVIPSSGPMDTSKSTTWSGGSWPQGRARSSSGGHVLLAGTCNSTTSGRPGARTTARTGHCRIFGTVGQVRARTKMCTLTPMSARRGWVVPAEVAKAAQISTTGLEPEVLVPPRPGRAGEDCPRPREGSGPVLRPNGREGPSGSREEGNRSMPTLEFIWMAGAAPI